MVYVRKKNIYGNDYWYACSSKRKGEKVKQSTEGYIGPCREYSYKEAKEIAKNEYED